MLVVLIVLYVGTQLVSGMVSTVTADPTQRRIMLALPFIFVIFIINFEAGLIVYWITTNTWTIGQQFLVRKLFPKPDPVAASASGSASGPTVKPARGKPAAESGGNGGGTKKAPPPGARKKKKRTGQEALGMADDPRSEAEGATLGEAKRTAFKELEPSTRG